MDNSIGSDQFFWRDISIGLVEAADPAATPALSLNPETRDVVVASGDSGLAEAAIAPATSPNAANPFPTTINLSSLGALGIRIGGQMSTVSGFVVSAAGDVNNDGIADFVIGNVGRPGTLSSMPIGEEYVIFGKVGLSSFTLSTGIAAADGFYIHGEDYSENSGTTFSYAGIGDINNDGFADVMFGASAYNTGSAAANDNVGAAYVVFGKSTGIGPVQLGGSMGSTGFKITGAEAQGQIGQVSAAGDFNHDGIADFAVGGRFVDANGTDSGAVQVFFGKASGWANLTFGSAATPSIILKGAAGDWLGGKISSAGDVNGDGIDDLIISATHGPTTPSYNTTNGFAYVVYGSAAPAASLNVSTMPLSAGFKITGDSANKVLGVDVAGIGDFNGDGFDDVAVSSGEYYGSAGRTYIVFGHAAGAAVTVSDAMATTTGFTIIGSGKQDAGYSISRAGDVNGDGLADIIIGAPTRADIGAPAAYVIFGKASGIGTINLSSLAAADGFKILGATGSTTGFSVSGGGDVNGDHVDDLLVSAPGEGANGQGATYVIFGISSAPVNTVPVIDLNGASAGAGTTLAYTENAGAIAIATAATVTDTDSADFNGGTMTLSFTANGAAEDRLTIINQGSGAGQIGVTGSTISYGGTTIGSFTGGTNGSTPLVITFSSGSATPAAAQALTRAIAYNNVSDAPSTGARTVQFVVTDGDGGTSSATSATINVTAVNDAPVNTKPGGQSFAEDTSRTFNTTNGNLISIADLDAGGSLVQVTVGVAHGALTLSGVGGLNFSTGDGTADATMTFQGTLANINAALSGLLYAPTLNYNGGDTLTITTSDLGNTGTGGALNDTDTVAITVTSVNDAPTGSDGTFNVGQGMGRALTIADFGYGDVEGDAFTSITIASTASAGRLLYQAPGATNFTAVTLGQVVSTTDIAAGRLVFKMPFGGTATSGNFTFRVHDDGGTANGGVDLDATPNRLTFNVQPNVAPQGQDSTHHITRGESIVLSAADFGFTDSDGYDFDGVTVTTAATAGRLLYLAPGASNYATVTAGQFISAIDIAAGRLTFKLPDAAAASSASITFQVHDNGGTALGGIDTDQSPNTLTFDTSAPPQVSIVAPHSDVAVGQGVSGQMLQLPGVQPDPGNLHDVLLTLGAHHDLGSVVDTLVGQAGPSLGLSGHDAYAPGLDVLSAKFDDLFQWHHSIAAPIF